MQTGSEAPIGVRADYAYGSMTGWSTQATYRLANTNVYIGGGCTYSGSQYVERQRTKVAIDPNVRVRGNDTYTGFEDVTGPIAVGEVVDVYEPESGVAGEGRVTEIDGNKELVYLSVDWSSLTADHAVTYVQESSPTQMLFVAEGPIPVTGVTDDWLGLIARPCLADIRWGDATLCVTAPAITATFDSLRHSSGWSSRMEIRQLRVSLASSRGVAA